MASKANGIPILRNTVEYIAILAIWFVLLQVANRGGLSEVAMSWMIVVACWLKSIFFGSENMSQLLEAARNNLSHHRFLMLMAINMTQMILSFAFDFHLLYCINRSSFLGVTGDVSDFEALFDFFYLSTLNFSFFGYSDILPQTIAAKTVNLTEIVLAFITVIFLLSDFISLKDSLRSQQNINAG